MSKAYKQTTKLVKGQRVIGETEYIDKSTGEVMPCLEVENVLMERDFNFDKLWLSQYLSVMDEISNKRRKLADWLVDHKNKENEITYTYRQIADATGFSLDTVRLTMKALLENKFLVRKNQGCYIINPDIVFHGGHTDRLAVVQVFKTVQASQADMETRRQLTLDDLGAIVGGDDDGPEHGAGGPCEEGVAC